MDKLKKCPFCGGEAKLFKQRGTNYIICNTGDIEICPVSPNTRHWTASNLKNVIKAWNTRAEEE